MSFLITRQYTNRRYCSLVLVEHVLQSVTLVSWWCTLFTQCQWQTDRQSAHHYLWLLRCWCNGSKLFVAPSSSSSGSVAGSGVYVGLTQLVSMSHRHSTTASQWWLLARRTDKAQSSLGLHCHQLNLLYTSTQYNTPLTANGLHRHQLNLLYTSTQYNTPLTANGLHCHQLNLLYTSEMHSCCHHTCKHRLCTHNGDKQMCLVDHITAKTTLDQ